MTFEDVSEIPTINRVEWLDYFAQRATERNEIRYSTNCDNEQEIIIAVKNAGNRYSRNKKGKTLDYQASIQKQKRRSYQKV